MLHPYIKVVLAIIVIAGVIASPNVIQLLILLIFLFSLLLINKRTKNYLSFGLFFIVPLFIALSILYLVILPLASNGSIQHNLKANSNYVFVTVLRLMNLVALFQFIFGTNEDELFSFFKKLHLSNETIFTFMGGLVIWEDIKKKTGRIFDATIARGLYPKRNLITKIIILPKIIKPLLNTLFNDAIVRSEVWKQKEIIKKINEYVGNRPRYSTPYNILLLSIGILWISWIFIFR